MTTPAQKSFKTSKIVSTIVIVLTYAVFIVAQPQLWWAYVPIGIFVTFGMRSLVINAYRAGLKTGQYMTPEEFSAEDNHQRESILIYRKAPRWMQF